MYTFQKKKKKKKEEKEKSLLRRVWNWSYFGASSVIRDLNLEFFFLAF